MSRIGSGLLILLSIVLALVASYSVYSYMTGAKSPPKPAPTVAVLTAAQDIAARTVITDGMLRVTQVPSNLKLAQALGTVTEASGKVSMVAISQGEQILPDKLAGTADQSGLAFVIPAGKRAVAVNVNEVVGSGGLILPGDAVDVVAVIDTRPSVDPAALNKAAPETTSVAQYILQNVQVLAVAQQIEGSPPAADGSAKAPLNLPINSASPPSQTVPNAKTATLAVSPQEAERLVLAEDKGRIRLVLRPHGDQTTIPTDDGLFGNQNGTATLNSSLTPS